MTQGLKKNECHPELIRNIANQTIDTWYQKDTKNSTDGSINQCGISTGIYNSLTLERISLQIKEKILIKTTEIAAISMAMQIGQKSPQKYITILTDSRSSCTSIRNTYSKKTKPILWEQNPSNSSKKSKQILQNSTNPVSCWNNKLASTQNQETNSNQISIKTPLQGAKNKNQWINKNHMAFWLPTTRGKSTENW